MLKTIKFDEAIYKLDAKKIGKNYMALCPCHSDTDRSLSIFKGDNNKAVFHCFAGCKHSEIYNFLNENNNYIPTKENINIPKNNINIPKKERKYSLEFLKNNSTSLYVYTDENNKPVFLVRRYSTLQKTKNFAQYSFIDSSTLKLGLNNNKTFLYNLSDLISGIKEGRAIFVVEGEKDVETLKKLNLIGTTSPMGGGRSKWKEHFNQYFKDARVIILPDNDLTGKEHAENIIKNLTGIAKEIKLINLPDLKEKGDITDWIQAGHDKKELFEIINNTAPYEAEEKEKKSKITPVEPLQKNEKSYSIEEVREEIKKIIHSDSQENILIKTLAGSGKTVTILKEINSITEENKKYKNCFTLTSKHFNYLTRKKEEDSKEVKEYKDFLRKTLKPLKNVIFDRYINMFQALKEKIYSYFNNEKNTIEAINEIMFNSSFKNHRFAYSSPFLKNIEELQKSGILDPSMWKIIKSRELKDDKNPAGNCYKKKEIDKLIERRINPTLRLCNNVDCPHYQECFSDKDMYLGQWQEKEKHIALSHKMLAMARGRLKDIHQIIIDENPLTAFLEKIDIVNTIKLEDKDRNKIDLAITEFEKSYSLDDKKALPLFKAIRNIIKNLLLSGRKEKKHICLTG
ncbi:MAG TPA: CHC2 zinc finger domain-containing protein, partial [Exilispira sp.]|nr:CHC2 zinc finger domain-containing protein [Exilispira sp.]